MSPFLADLGRNLRDELRRWRRSQRGWLWLVPPVAAPIGSAIADLYLKVPATPTAEILGLLIAGGLTSLILLDLAALAAGEDLALRAHLTGFALPQDRRAILAGRLIAVLGAGMGAYAIAAAGAWEAAVLLVAPDPLTHAFLDPSHLAWAVPGFLLFLAGVTVAGAVYTRTSAQGIVAGVLAAVVVAGVTGDLLAHSELTLAFPAVLAAAGAGSLGWAVARYPTVP